MELERLDQRDGPNCFTFSQTPHRLVGISPDSLSIISS